MQGLASILFTGPKCVIIAYSYPTFLHFAHCSDLGAVPVLFLSSYVIEGQTPTPTIRMLLVSYHSNMLCVAY